MNGQESLSLSVGTAKRNWFETDEHLHHLGLVSILSHLDFLRLIVWVAAYE